MKNVNIKKYTPFIIGLVISLVLLIGGFGILSGSFTRASDEEPRDVVVSATEKTASISWSTGNESIGILKYGVSSTEMNSPVTEIQRTQKHLIKLDESTGNGLAINTTYYFVIKIGSKTYDNGGVPWTFTTKGAAKSSVSITVSPVPSVTATPTPGQKVIQKLNVNTNQGTSTCTESNCDKIKAKLGKGCGLKDYWYCIQRTTPSNFR